MTPADRDVDLARLAAAAPSRAARVISTVLTPSVTLLATCAYVALRHDRLGPAALWWVITLVLVVGVPYAVLFRAIRAGRVDDHHVVRRGQRGAVMVVAVGCVASALAALVLLGAPRAYVAMLVSMLAGLLVIIAATAVGKPSLHVAVATGSVVVLAVENPVLAWTGLLLVPLAWARVREGRHSVGQVVAGVLIGAGVTGVLYPLLR
jgi:membrane-associated phospholipid phosphatase